MAQSVTLEELYVEYLSKSTSKVIDKQKFTKYVRQKSDKGYKYTEIQVFLNGKKKKTEDQNTSANKLSTMVKKPSGYNSYKENISISNLRRNLKKTTSKSSNISQIKSTESNINVVNFRNNLKKTTTKVSAETNNSLMDISNLRSNLRKTPTAKTTTKSSDINTLKTTQEEFNVLNLKHNLKKTKIDLDNDKSECDNKTKDNDHDNYVSNLRNRLKKVEIEPKNMDKYKANYHASQILPQANEDDDLKSKEKRMNNEIHKIQIDCINNENTRHTSMHSSCVHFNLDDASIYSTWLYIHGKEYQEYTILQLKKDICDKWCQDAIIDQIYITPGDYHMIDYLIPQNIVIKYNSHQVDDMNQLVSNYGKRFQVWIDFQKIYWQAFEEDENVD